MATLGKVLILSGVLLAGLGLVLILADRIPWLGRLPGDIVIERKNFTFYFPVLTCLLLSAVLTLIMWILNARR